MAMIDLHRSGPPTPIRFRYVVICKGVPFTVRPFVFQADTNPHSGEVIQRYGEAMGDLHAFSVVAGNAAEAEQEAIALWKAVIESHPSHWATDHRLNDDFEVMPVAYRPIGDGK